MCKFCSLLNNWNYLWNIYCNSPFLAICRSLVPLFIFLVSSWYQKAKIGLRMSLLNKKWLIIILKVKTTCYKTKSKFSQCFFSHWLLHRCFFLFLYQSICKFWKIDKILLESYHCVQKWRKFENANSNILPKTYSF